MPEQGRAARQGGGLALLDAVPWSSAIGNAVDGEIVVAGGHEILSFLIWDTLK